VTGEDTLELNLAPGGGTAIRFTPAGGVEQGELRRMENVPAGNLKPRDIRIWLPPGFDASGETRYPVLYMHDGQNLFEPGFSYGGVEWGVDEVMSRLIADGKIRPAIVVGVSNTEDRWREYVPAGIMARLPRDLRNEIANATGGKPLSDAYLRFLVDELKPMIDRDYPTLTAPEDTLLAGSSMGGLITLYGLAEYPDVFGAGAAVSTHWPLYDPDMSSPETVIPAIADYLEDSSLDPDAQRIWFDHGTENLDGYYAPYQDAVIENMAGLGFEAGANMAVTVYDGADHNEASWNARLDEILVFLLGE
jgi:enterochelin esterase-like enzyme